MEVYTEKDIAKINLRNQTVYVFIPVIHDGSVAETQQKENSNEEPRQDNTL